MTRHTSFRARGEQVEDADVSERATSHHAVIAASSAVAVKVARLDAERNQILTRRAVFSDRASRRDVVCRDRVTERAQATGALDWLDWSWFRSQVNQERRFLNVRAIRIPVVQFAFARLNDVPLLVLVP